jgi:capsular exopolysaccharide synthesis family protein
VKPSAGGTGHFGGIPPYPGGAPQSGDGGDSLDIRAMLLPIWRRKWLVAFVAIIFVALSLLLALNMESRYTASARVIFDPERLRIIDLDNVVVSPDVSTTGLQNQVEILRSAVLLERVIETLRLESTPEFNPALRNDPLTLFERGVARLPLPERVKALLVDLGLIRPQIPFDLTTQELAERLRASTLETLIDNLRLRPIPNSRVIEINYTSPNARLAAAIANSVGEQYIIVQIEAKRDDIVSASEMLSTRVADLENRYNIAEEAVRNAQVELSMQAEFGSAMISPQLEVVNTSLTNIRLEREAMQARHDRARTALETGRDLEIISDFRDSEVIRGFRARAIELGDQAASMRAIVGASNPDLQRLEARIVEVERNIMAEAGNIVAALAGEVEAMQAREASLEAELARLEGRASQQSQAEMRLSRLEREAEASRTIYENFLNRLKEASEQAALQTSDARFLTRASTPDTPDNATRRLLVVLGGLGGIAAGVGFVFLLELLSNTYRNPTDLESDTGLPVLAAIPHAGRRKRPRDLITYVLRKPNSTLAESVRNLRTSILFSNLDRPPKVVMFSSSLPEEGKTTTAMLAAITSRQMGRSAIIVDCDLRRQTLASIFPEEAERPGLLGVLEGSSSIDDAVFKEPETGLHVLAPGRAAAHHGNPADILSSQRFQKLIDELRARYDLVILDTPPALVVTDARIIAQIADAVVYLVRWDHTRKAAVQEGLRELASVNAKVAGLALSLVSEARAANFANSDYLYKQTYRNYVSS